VDFLFFADALEHTFCSGAFYADGNAGMLGFESPAEFFRDQNLHRGVERDHRLLLGGRNHGRADCGRLRRGG
jgi:hypothetical protein